MERKELRALIRKCEEVSGVMKSLSHPVRLKVLCQALDGEKTVSELTEFCGISQSAMSQFLGRMSNEGLLQSRREGTKVYYSIKDRKIAKLLSAVKEVYCE